MKPTGRKSPGKDTAAGRVSIEDWDERCRAALIGAVANSVVARLKTAMEERAPRAQIAPAIPAKKSRTPKRPAKSGGEETPKGRDCPGKRRNPWSGSRRE